MGDLDHVKFGGETVDRRTSNMLREAQRIANEQDPTIGKLHLSQGCFCHGVAASAGTHSGAGAFDLSVRGYSEHQKEVIALSLRKVGFASWRRMPSQGPWPEHIHGIAMGSKDLPSVAQSQVRSYLSGHNGLVGNARDTQDRPSKILTWEQYEAKYLPDGQPPTNPTADPASPDQTAGQVTQGADDPYAIDSGQGVSMTKDSDGDGLTDDFEKMSRTDPFNADSNGNGITDGQEFIASGGRGSGVTIDANHDGVADWLETAALTGQSAGSARTAPNARQYALGQTSIGARAGVGTDDLDGGLGTGAGGVSGTYAGTGLGNGLGGGVGAAPGVGTVAGTGLPAGATGSGTEPLDGTGTGATGVGGTGAGGPGDPFGG